MRYRVEGWVEARTFNEAVQRLSRLELVTAAAERVDGLPATVLSLELDGTVR